MDLITRLGELALATRLHRLADMLMKISAMRATGTDESWPLPAR